MELFVRKINLQLYQREYPPLKSSIAAGRRGFINEISFILFERFVIARREGKFDIRHFLSTAVPLARATISRLENLEPNTVTDPDEDESKEIIEQSRRTYRFFVRVADGSNIEVSPRFAGCGIVDTCFGDVYFDGALFEVKAGERSFRSADLRQLLTYAALNKAENARQVHRLGLFNPRVGISWSEDLDEVCQQAAGRPSSDLLNEIIRTISSGDTSR